MRMAGDPNYFQDEIKGVSASGGVASVPIMRGGYYWVDQNVNPAAAAGVGIGVAAVVGGVAFVVWKLRSNFHCTRPFAGSLPLRCVSRVHCAVPCTPRCLGCTSRPHSHAVRSLCRRRQEVPPDGRHCHGRLVAPVNARVSSLQRARLSSPRAQLLTGGKTLCVFFPVASWGACCAPLRSAALSSVVPRLNRAWLVSVPG